MLKLANMKKNYTVEGFVLEKVKCIRQWEPSADSHFTGNKRSEKKVSEQDSDMFSGDYVTKCRMDSGGTRDQAGCTRGRSAMR